MSSLKRFAIAAGFVAAAVVPTVASAQSRVEYVTPSNNRNYTVCYHQQQDLVNPKGIRVSGPNRAWNYNIGPKVLAPGVSGTAVNAYNPAIFIETRTTIAPEYYSLVPGAGPCVGP